MGTARLEPIMNATHIKTNGMSCEACPSRIESRLENLEGVKAARAYRTMRLTSVLYDPDLVDVETIRHQIEDAGFHTDELVERGADPLAVQQRLHEQAIARILEARE